MTDEKKDGRWTSEVPCARGVEGCSEKHTLRVDAHACKVEHADGSWKCSLCGCRWNGTPPTTCPRGCSDDDQRPNEAPPSVPPGWLERVGEDVAEARVDVLDDVCTWLAASGHKAAADHLYATRNRFICADREGTNVTPVIAVEPTLEALLADARSGCAKLIAEKVRLLAALGLLTEEHGEEHWSEEAVLAEVRKLRARCSDKAKSSPTFEDGYAAGVEASASVALAWDGWEKDGDRRCADEIRRLVAFTPCDRPYADCSTCKGSGDYHGDPCSICVWRRWAEDAAAAGALATPEEIQADRDASRVDYAIPSLEKYAEGEALLEAVDEWARSRDKEVSIVEYLDRPRPDIANARLMRAWKAWRNRPDSAIPPLALQTQRKRLTACDALTEEAESLGLYPTTPTGSKER